MHLRPQTAASALATICLVAGAAAQDASIDQIHPRTSVQLGLGIGGQDLETNTGRFPGDPNVPAGVPTGVVSRSADAYHVRGRFEHFFSRGIGVFFDGHIGMADDINKDLGSTDSSLTSQGVFLAAAYRATMGSSFRLPVRFGPYLEETTLEDANLTDGDISVTNVGMKLSAEPEFVLTQRIGEGGRVSELSVYTEFACGAGPSMTEDDVDSEDGYAFLFNWELGFRYRFANGLTAGLSYIARKNYAGATESYDNAVFFGQDSDFAGVLLTAGWRF